MNEGGLFLKVSRTGKVLNAIYPRPGLPFPIQVRARAFSVEFQANGKSCDSSYCKASVSVKSAKTSATRSPLRITAS